MSVTNDEYKEQEDDYEELHDVISMSGFDFQDWRNGEKSILRPRLEEAGFTEVFFIMGERDSFGPLSRIIHCKDSDGNFRRLFYG